MPWQTWRMSGGRWLPDEIPMIDRRIAPIDLAAAADFVLGGTQVRPSSREVSGAGLTIALEPRVMQVLVALATRAGRTVSRDDLLAGCWGGAVVGDDALQRCIGRLRKVAQMVGGFEIETLSRIGYRLHAEAAVDGGAPPPSGGRGSLLAVLPFDVPPHDPAAAFLGDALADEILQTIGRRSSIKAVGRTSSFQFRGARKDVAEIERSLGATHVLDGSVQCANGRIRVSAQLVDLGDKTMLWSDRFDGQLDDVFAVQEAVAGATVTALRGVFREALPTRSASPATLELVHRLRSTLSPLSGRPIDGDWKAWARFETVAGEDAEAWGLLAVVYASLRWTVHPGQERQVRDAARAAAEQALGLDPRCGSAHKALYLLEPPTGRFLEIEQKLARAHEAAPQDGDVCWSLYYHYMSVGRLGASFAAAENAYRVDPLRPPNALAYANALYSADRRAEAVALMHHSIERWPDDPMVYAVALWTAAAAGEFAFVDQVLRQRRHERFGAEAQAMIAPAMSAVDMIRRPTRRGCDKALTRLEEDIRQGPPRFSLVGLCAYLGADLDALYDLLDRADFSALRLPETRLAPLDGLGHLFLRVNGRLRSHSRFAALCRRLGLAEYWSRNGQWPDCARDPALAYDFVALSQAP
jgi:adenylate cyclase